FYEGKELVGASCRACHLDHIIHFRASETSANAWMIEIVDVVRAGGEGQADSVGGSRSTRRAAGRLFLGTSGFAYKEWKPEFYPADLKAADMLSFFSRRFNSVEINNTFYKMPTEKLLTQWTTQTPEEFRFTLKAPQRITHFSRLK